MDLKQSVQRLWLISGMSLSLRHRKTGRDVLGLWMILQRERRHGKTRQEDSRTRRKRLKWNSLQYLSQSWCKIILVRCMFLCKCCNVEYEINVRMISFLAHILKVHFLLDLNLYMSIARSSCSLGNYAIQAEYHHYLQYHWYLKTNLLPQSVRRIYFCSQNC